LVGELLGESVYGIKISREGKTSDKDEKRIQRGETSGSVVDMEEEKEGREHKAEGGGAWRNPYCDYSEPH
jgi:hypothetical protein